MNDIEVTIIGPIHPYGKTFKLDCVLNGPSLKSKLVPGEKIESREHIYLKTKGERHYTNMEVYGVMEILYEEDGFKHATFLTPCQSDQLAALNLLKELCEERKVPSMKEEILSRKRYEHQDSRIVHAPYPEFDSLTLCGHRVTTYNNKWQTVENMPVTCTRCRWQLEKRGVHDVTPAEGKPKHISETGTTLARQHQIITDAVATLRGGASSLSNRQAREDVVEAVVRINSILYRCWVALRRDPLKYINSDEYRYIRPASFVKAYYLALEYAEQYATRKYTADITTFHHRWTNFDMAYKHVWKENEKKAKAKKKRHHGYMWAYIGFVAGVKLEKMEPCDHFKSVEDFLSATLGTEWQEIVKAAKPFHVYKLRLEEIKEPVVAETISFEDIT